jgi:hypothetical protein
MWIEVDTTPSPHAHTRHLLFSFLFQTPQLHAPSSASYASRCPSWLTSRGLGVMVVHAAAAVRALSHPPPALKLCTKGAPAEIHFCTPQRVRPHPARLYLGTPARLQLTRTLASSPLPALSWGQIWPMPRCGPFERGEAGQSWFFSFILHTTLVRAYFPELLR